MTKVYCKAIVMSEKIKRTFLENDGQGAVDTAVICEPFSWEWKV